MADFRDDSLMLKDLWFVSLQINDGICHIRNHEKGNGTIIKNDLADFG